MAHQHKWGYLYVLLRESDCAIKVGYSADPVGRATVMRRFPNNGKVLLLFQIEAWCMQCNERTVHKSLEKFRLPYDPQSGSTEWFQVHPYNAVDAILEEVGYK